MCLNLNNLEKTKIIVIEIAIYAKLITWNG